MKDFLIGQIVTVTAVSDLGYDENDQRQVQRHPCQPFTAAITGQAVRFLGRFHKGNRGGNFEDYEQASLEVTGSRVLWTVRTGMVNKELLVDDADLVALQRDFGQSETVLPRQGRKINYIYEDVPV